ncbi:uncharacterized protein LOC111388212 [Olea europaea var. sylvestris]|uniref:uncharacterized protein LOC111388212 n=1 Tax=Olea europaea var. sylvestris TaxID=158386 RepID=UPI000C1D073E|nr:uncharacterized protein LOC111388212 [Olea europaea var. sylvestris]
MFQKSPSLTFFRKSRFSRIITIAIQTCIEPLRASIYLNIIIFWKLAIWTIMIVTLPMRAIAALHRVRLQELQLHGVRTELESVLWDRNELEEELFMAIKKHKMMEIMLEELEGEHEENIVRIQLLEGEVNRANDDELRICSWLHYSSKILVARWRIPNYVFGPTGSGFEGCKSTVERG